MLKLFSDAGRYYLSDKICIGIVGLVLAADSMAAAVLPFDPGPFNTLGGINTSAASDSALSASLVFVKDGLDAAAARSLAQGASGSLSRSGSLAIEAYGYIQALKTIYDVSEASNVRAISSTLSGYDTRAVSDRISQYSAGLRAVQNGLPAAVDTPPIATYVAAAVDPNARVQISSANRNAAATISSLESLSGDLQGQKSIVEDTRRIAQQASSSADQRAEMLSEFLGTLPVFTIDPAVNSLKIAVGQAIGQLTLASQDFADLASEASSLLTAVEQLQNRTSELTASYRTASAIYETALSIPMARATYAVSGALSVNQPGYSINFSGNQFTGQGLELPSRFVVGSLGFFNGSGVIGIDEHSLALTLTRTLTVDGYGTWTASGNANLTLKYETTAYDDDPFKSADRIYIEEIVRGAAVFEGEFAIFDVIGGVNSPFKIYDLNVAPGFENVAFITTAPLNNVDEPSSLALALLGFTAFVAQRVRLKGGSNVNRLASSRTMSISRALGNVCKTRPSMCLTDS